MSEKKGVLPEKAVYSGDGTEKDPAYRASLNFIARRPRSRRETEDYLIRKGFSKAAVAGAVSRLDGYGYLNDEVYARMLVESRDRLNPRSASALRAELASRGVDEAAAGPALERLDELDAARRAVEKGLYRWRGSDRAGFTRKAMAFLARRGFSFEISAEVCARAWEAMAEEFEKDR